MTLSSAVYRAHIEHYIDTHISDFQGNVPLLSLAMCDEHKVLGFWTCPLEDALHSFLCCDEAIMSVLYVSERATFIAIIPSSDALLLERMVQEMCRIWAQSTLRWCRTCDFIAYTYDGDLPPSVIGLEPWTHISPLFNRGHSHSLSTPDCIDRILHEHQQGPVVRSSSEHLYPWYILWLDMLRSGNQIHNDTHAQKTRLSAAECFKLMAISLYEELIRDALCGELYNENHESLHTLLCIIVQKYPDNMIASSLLALLHYGKGEYQLSQLYVDQAVSNAKGTCSFARTVAAVIHQKISPQRLKECILAGAAQAQYVLRAQCN